MSETTYKIGIIGAGNMGEAFIGALIRSGLSQPAAIYVSDILPERLQGLQKTYGVAVTTDNTELFDACDIIVLAVKPQQMAQVLSQLAGKIPPNKRKLIISVAAGIPTQKIEAYLYKTLSETMRNNLPIVRVMPNTPALVLAGMSGMSTNRFATKDDILLTRRILGALGQVLEFEEKDLDAVTALSGSGPAYVFYLIEAMIQGGIANGLAPEDAGTLSLATVKGAVKLMEEQKEPAEVLRRKVTSPGGTTEAALALLEQHRVKDNIIAAISAATRRSKELSR